MCSLLLRMEIEGNDVDEAAVRNRISYHVLGDKGFSQEY
jgi:hypothetical protein